MYRGKCGARSDAVCEACTSKPANASYLTSGQPWDADNCTWQCDVGFWRSGESCVSCTTAACGAGWYRGECEAEADAACLPCNSGQLPKYSHFIASANASACKWSCNVLYHGSCMLLISHVQFLNVVGQVGGSNGSKPLAAFSEGFGWANMDFPAVFPWRSSSDDTTDLWI